MNRRNFLILGGTAATLALSAHPLVEIANREFDSYLKEKFEEFQEMKEDELRMHAEGILENRITLKSDISYMRPTSRSISEARKRAEGNGYLIQKDDGLYIITAAHIVNINSVTSPTDGGYLAPQNVRSRVTWKNKELEQVAIDRVRDSAVFRVHDIPEEFNLPEYRIKLGNSDELEPFKKVYLLGNPQLEGTNIREGIVSNKEKLRTPEGMFNSRGFNISIKSFPGDSGNAVINEEGELVGLISQRHYGHSAYVTSINWFKNQMEYQNQRIASKNERVFQR